MPWLWLIVLRFPDFIKSFYDHDNLWSMLNFGWLMSILWVVQTAADLWPCCSSRGWDSPLRGGSRERGAGRGLGQPRRHLHPGLRVPRGGRGLLPQDAARQPLPGPDRAATLGQHRVLQRGGVGPGAVARGNQVRILIRLVREGLKKYGGGGVKPVPYFFLSKQWDF